MSERRASPLAEYILFKEKHQQAERIASGPNAEKQQELHDKIVSGEIDIGPVPDHSAPVKDIRPKYDGEEAYLIHKASRNGSHIDVRAMPELRQLLDEPS